MSIFDRIAAAIELMLDGVKKEAADLRDHIDAIDGHLDGDAAHNTAVEDHLSINEDVPDDAGHVDVIYDGLQKIIDASQSPAEAKDDTNSEPPAGTPLTVGELAANTPVSGITSAGVPATVETAASVNVGNSAPTPAET